MSSRSSATEIIPGTQVLLEFQYRSSQEAEQTEKELKLVPEPSDDVHDPLVEILYHI